jgi:IstB-like ATP binding protein
MRSLPPLITQTVLQSLEECDFSFRRSAKKQVIEHLGQLDFLHGKENVALLGPPGTGKKNLATAISVSACLAGQRVALVTGHLMGWKARRRKALGHPRGRARTPVLHPADRRRCRLYPVRSRGRRPDVQPRLLKLRANILGW